MKRLGLIVIDADRHNEKEDGVETLRKLCAERGDLPPHPWARTANNGEHHYFKQPPDRKIGNKKIGPGLETRGFKSENDGGYVIAPGSRLSDGRRWQCGEGSPSLLEGYQAGAIPAAPAWLLDSTSERQQRAYTNGGGPQDRDSRSREAVYAQAALDGVAAELARAEPGGRNNALNAAAFRMGTMIARGWIARADVGDALCAACQQNGLLHNEGANAVQATLASGLRAGEQEPHPDLTDRREDFGSNGQTDEARRRSNQEQVHAEDEQRRPEEPEILWHGQVDPSESRPYLVQGVVPAVGTGLISGQWGTFKTFTLFDLFHCVMTGESFLGCEIMRRGGVLFVALEGNDEVAIRLQAVIDYKGKLLGRAPFAWVETCPPLIDKNAAEELCKLAKRVAEELKADFDLPLSLIGIDTMIAAAGYAKDGQENDAATGQAIMNTLRQVARQAHCFVMGVDHFGKAVETGTRGSSAKEGAADVVFALLGDRSISGEAKNTRLALRKSRGGANGREFPFRSRKVDMGVDKFGKPISTLVIDWAATGEAPAAAKAKADPRWSKSLRLLRQVLMNLLVDHGTEQRIHANGPIVRTVNIETVRAEFYRSYLVDGDSEAKKAAARRQAFNRAVNHAHAEGVIGLRDFGTQTVIWLATQEPATSRP
jgi:AAA domain/Bifunctional DNA primase/polymerase, N-terminal